MASEEKEISTYRKVTLRRDYFTVLSDGHSEFEWFLRELGIPDEQHSDIEEIEVTVDGAKYTVEDYGA